MKQLPYLLVIALAVALVLMYLHKPSGHDRELKRLEVHYKNQIDSLQNSYEYLLRKKDSAAFQLFKRTQENANRMEAESIIWKRLYEAQKKRKTAILNSGSYDSILTVLYPGQP